MLAKDIRIGSWLFLLSLPIMFGSMGMGDAFIGAADLDQRDGSCRPLRRQQHRHSGLLRHPGHKRAAVGTCSSRLIAIAMLKMRQPSMYLVILHVMMGMIAVISPFTSIIFFGAARCGPICHPK